MIIVSICLMIILTITWKRIVEVEVGDITRILLCFFFILFLLFCVTFCLIWSSLSFLLLSRSHLHPHSHSLSHTRSVFVVRSLSLSFALVIKEEVEGQWEQKQEVEDQGEKKKKEEVDILEVREGVERQRVRLIVSFFPLFSFSCFFFNSFYTNNNNNW